MDKIALVNEDILAGRYLINALDNSEFEVRAAMWFYRQEDNDWRFIIASPYVDKNGPKKSYQLIQDKLDKFLNGTLATQLEEPFYCYLSLDEISAVGLHDNLIKLMRSSIKTEIPIKFTRNVINNVLIDDAYIYRMR